MAFYYPVASASKTAKARRKLLGVDNSTLFRLCRLVGTVVLGALVLRSPSLGANHADIGWLLMLVIGPLGSLVDFYTPPEHRLPAQTAFDLGGLALCTWFLPGVWMSAMVLGALIVSGSVPRFALTHKLLFVALPTGLIAAMTLIAREHNIADTYFVLLALAFGAPYCLIYALREQRRADELRGRANVMDSLARMAGGIGHDFNNLLTGIQGNAELAEQKLDRNHVARPFLQAMLAESQKAQLFSAQLLAFSGGVATGRARLDLRAELQGIASLLESAMPVGVRLRLEAEQGLPLVSGNRAQLQEIIVASILHVADSIRSGSGEVSVTLRKATRRFGEEVVLQARPVQSERPVGDLPRTESGPHMADGLASVRFALASARVVMREHDGHIALHGDWRSGLAIALRIPGLPATQSNGYRVPAPGKVVPRQVLLVEAAPRVRAVAQNLLLESGHTVTCAANGSEALAVLASAQPIDVVMLDSGFAESRALIARIDELRADIPVLLPGASSVSDGMTRGMNGMFGDFVEGRADSTRRNVSFVPKPYSLAGLNSALRRAFDAQSSSGSR